MSADALALAFITADLTAAGVPAIIAPTASRDVLARIRRGEDGPEAVRAVAADWGAVPSPSSSEPVQAQPAEPRRRVLHTVAGYIPLKAEAGR